MFGLDAGENFAGAASEGVLLLLEGLLMELGSSEACRFDVGVLRNDLELLSDGNSGLFGVAGDHDDVDAGSLALLDGASDLRSGRVSDANIAEEGAVSLELLVLLLVGKLIFGVFASHILHVTAVESDGDSEDTVALGSNGQDLIVYLLLAVGTERDLFALARHDLRALLDDSLGSTLQEDLVAGVAGVALDHSGHCLALRTELKGGDFAHTLHEVAGVACGFFLSAGALSRSASVVATNLLGESLHGSLCGLTHALKATFLGVLRVHTVHDVSSVVNGADHGEVLEASRLGELLFTELSDFAFRGVRVLFDVVFDDIIVAATNEAESDGAHLVLGESAGLVGADDARATKSLHGGQSAHNAVVGAHFASSKSQASRDDGGETLRDGSDGKSDGDLEVVDAALESGSVDWVEELSVVHGPHEEADDENDLGKELAEVVDLLLERRLLFVLLSSLHFGVNATNGCLHASVGNDADSGARADDGRGEEHVLLVLEHHGGITKLVGVLGHGLGLASQGRLLKLQGNRKDGGAAQISRHTLSLFDLDDVAGHEVFRVNGGPGIVAENRALLRLHLF
mmetsp:Transcript_33669/g.39569  ORF Transcript_33669/g.39569 Transcript_33669/m.39569 type:complete len:572 (-) Transcript_33669:477-2192(-)